jgi:sugar O-acyltransferase (sialic acid O-acetyltransferase NeuD family)
MSREVIIFGAGGHARSVADVMLSSSPDAHITFVDESAKPEEEIFGFDVVTNLDIPAESDGREYFVAIGNNGKRKAQREILGQLATSEVLALDAHIGKDAEIGAGVFIGHAAYIGPLVKIGEGTIINTRALIEHEGEIGANSQISPGAIIAGRVKLGENVFVGIGARIIDGITVCSDVVIGASATVVESIESPGTYVGTPARIVSQEKA